MNRYDIRIIGDEATATFPYAVGLRGTTTLIDAFTHRQSAELLGHRLNGAEPTTGEYSEIEETIAHALEAQS